MDHVVEDANRRAVRDYCRAEIPDQEIRDLLEPLGTNPERGKGHLSPRRRRPRHRPVSRDDAL